MVSERNIDDLGLSHLHSEIFQTSHPITLQHQEILVSAAPLTASFVSQNKEAM